MISQFVEEVRKLIDLFITCKKRTIKGCDEN